MNVEIEIVDGAAQLVLIPQDAVEREITASIARGGVSISILRGPLKSDGDTVILTTRSRIQT